MRLLPTLLCGAAVTLTLVAAPAAVADDQLAASMCDYVAADDKNRLRKVLSDYRLRLRNIYDGVVCNGENLIRHAFKSNANDVGEFIVKQLPGSAVAASGDIGWAEGNGFAASPLLAVLKDRAGGGD
ncbi:DUF3718 domain-containing protein [Rheinheimera muenzenbergensis]|uniref:DUF3718 domain-containing protein n=1 Tax=Rheinheimera muenzenbergensis TaxID=1193628 RepID=A0ABU8CA11_9GAMM|nr:DUF3718 domain-containing protein [Gammaproteobacteria bacterium]MBU1557231.1 DUF3718 domain-containing protein [Gammaproteobacteria bacterium]MBU2072146.1 DUF3718 domain-containing protein [Gammaproteobacteria bacterium]MBU2182008.1 DUF3718 domain-containing protein [Gammaproteobacteria bacterium]MBU2203851.1 DUF3718 domain-containing protein [Gammaproteobacteria bacterium]